MFNDFEDEEEMEMPVPCQNCNETFDLLDGYGSDKWYPNTVICHKCHKLEEEEIERDEEIEELKNTISDANITIQDAQQEIENCTRRLKELGVVI